MENIVPNALERMAYALYTKHLIIFPRMTRNMRKQKAYTLTYD